jgi:hypothetical protein
MPSEGSPKKRKAVCRMLVRHDMLRKMRKQKACQPSRAETKAARGFIPTRKVEVTMPCSFGRRGVGRNTFLPLVKRILNHEFMFDRQLIG